MDNKERFNYTYSAKEREEIRSIREKYVTSTEKTEDKMAQLRRLDAAVTKKATSVSLAFGIIGTLIMGMGMSLVMTDIGENIGLVGIMAISGGVIIGVIGILFTCVAYPVYNYIIRTERKKIAPEIIRLTDELMK